MCHLVGIAQLLHSRRAIAATHNGNSVCLAQRLGHGPGTHGKLIKLKHAHRPVPDNRAGVCNGSAVELHSLRPDVQALPSVGDLPGLHNSGVSIRGKAVGDDGVHRQQQLHALVRRLFYHFIGVVHPLALQQRIADFAALSGGEGIGHATADNNSVGNLQQVVDDADLGGDLAAAQDSYQGPLGIFQRAAHDPQLLFDQEARHSRQVSCHAGGGGMGPVHGAESVGHIDIRKGGQLFGKLGVVLGLALFKAGVLQQQDLARLQSGGLGGGIFSHHIMGKEHLPAQQLGQALGHRGQGQLPQRLFPCLLRQLGRILALFKLLFHPLVKHRLGLAQMGASNNRRAVLQQVLNGGQGRHNTLVAGDGSCLLVLGDIEIAAQEHLLAGNVYICNGFFVIIHIDTLLFRVIYRFFISPVPHRPGKPFCRRAS